MIYRRTGVQILSGVVFLLSVSMASLGWLSSDDLDLFTSDPGTPVFATVEAGMFSSEPGPPSEAGLPAAPDFSSEPGLPSEPGLFCEAGLSLAPDFSALSAVHS